MKGIIGAISGDVIGSVFENRPIKTKEFDLFSYYSQFTDDTVMTLAIAKWLCEDKTSKDALIRNLKYFGNMYPNAGYGRNFYYWLKQESPEPYGSWANGSAMRVSPCAWVADSLEEAQELAKTSSIVTHNHPDGVIGALATSDAIYLARTGAGKDEIREHVESEYGYNLSLSLDEIRPSYKFEISCKKSVPESIICFLEADDFEDTIRNAVSLGGDADTQAAIAGSIASAYWDVPDDIYDETVECLDHFLLGVLMDFEERFI
ncbi:MAG: ADP-ribosylglycohydrolase family protein [Methanobrevibacter thaueri]|uniref:ADP-ribosylglycohydrolase family protein n=1 Tax=Methanobrevibacter thaueri TaxID=190975 RepID=A0A8T3V737_9EURY|nr:ADP-ribosylglycohydrolase family protein [Methanobrevibacter thaueri]MBE6501436.1 ADP-ribosylglycohydrolase family protein [Methanobrevibacter thaueri]